jgi:hypothetical protein
MTNGDRAVRCAGRLFDLLSKGAQGPDQRRLATASLAKRPIRWFLFDGVNLTQTNWSIRLNCSGGLHGSEIGCFYSRCDTRRSGMLVDATWSLAQTAMAGAQWLASLSYLQLLGAALLLGTANWVLQSGPRRALVFGLSASVFVLSLKLLRDPTLPLVWLTLADR